MPTVAAIESLAGFVPLFVVEQLAAEGGNLSVPAARRFPAAVLFADISGFTALTERLAATGPAGVESIARIVNAYFERLVDGVLAQGGEVVKFAGDSLLALWPSSPEGLPLDVVRAAQAAVACRSRLAAFVASAEAPLTVKFSIGAGEVTTAHLGGARERRETAVAGPPLQQVGTANDVARPEAMIVSPEAAALAPAGRLRGTPLADGSLRLESVVDPPQPVPARPLPHLPPGAAELLLTYVPAAIRSRLDAAQAGWVAELRRITILFVSLAGVDHTTPLALAQDVVRALQEAMYRFEGSVNKLSVDDKGTTFVGVLGLPPLAHEDDPVRGARAALAIRAKLKDLGVACAIGLTTGRAFCGIVGAPRRREYTIMGDVVNLAARLMQAAKRDGDIVCDQPTCRAARERISFTELPSLAVKGKAEPVPAYRPLGVTETTGRFQKVSRMVGREAERALLGAALEALVAAPAQGADPSAGAPAPPLFVIEGVAGVGKSRLVSGITAGAARTMAVLVGHGESTEWTTPYFAWRPILETLLGLDGAAARGIADRRAIARKRVGELPGDLVGLAPLLEEVLPLEIPPNDITVDMASEARADNTRRLVAGLIAHAAATRPVLLVVEDVQWLDSASWATLLVAARATRRLLTIVTTRPPVGSVPAEHDRLARSPGARRISLGPLSHEECIELVCRRLGVASLPDELAELLGERAQGNPFYCEEIADALRESDGLEIDDGGCRVKPGAGGLRALVPNTIEGLVTARIDRLAPAQQLAMKAASVIGRSFSVRTLREIYPVEAEKVRVPDLLRVLDVSDITEPEDRPGEPGHAFREAITREVAYNLMPFEQRRALHREVAASFEREHAKDLGPILPTLAHHWLSAEVHDKALDCLSKAGAHALRSHANREAARFLEEALRLAAGRADVDALTLARWERQLGLALFSTGDLVRGREHLRRALALLGRPAPATPLRLRIWFLGQVLRQAAHRLLPGRFVGGAGGPARDALLEAARAHERLSQLHFFAQEEVDTIAAAVATLNEAELCGPSAELAQAYATMCLAAGVVFSHALARAYEQRALDTAALVGRPGTRAYVLQVTGCYEAGTGAWAKALASLEEGAAIARRIGDGRRCDECTANAAIVRNHTGDLRRSAELFGAVYHAAMGRDDPQAQVWGLLGMARNNLDRGEAEAARALIEQAQPLLESQGSRLDRASATEAQALLALAELRLGLAKAARPRAEGVAAHLAATEVVTYYTTHVFAAVIEVLLSLAETAPGGAEADGALAKGRATAEALARFARRFPIAEPAALIARGRLEKIVGRAPRSERALERAAARAEALAMPQERALALSRLGRLPAR